VAEPPSPLFLEVFQLARRRWVFYHFEKAGERIEPDSAVLKLIERALRRIPREENCGDRNSFRFQEFATYVGWVLGSC
jgi:hypothetical protein